MNNCDKIGVRDVAEESLSVGLLVQFLWSADLKDESDLLQLASRVDQAKKPLVFLTQALMYLAREMDDADEARRNQLRSFSRRLLWRDLDGLPELSAEWRALLDRKQAQPPAAGVGDALVKSLDELLSQLWQTGLPSSPIVATYAVDPSMAQEATAAAGPVYLIEGAAPEYAVAGDAESARLLAQADIQQVRPVDVDPDKPVLVVASTPQSDERLSMVSISSSNIAPDDFTLSLPGASAEELLTKYQESEAWFSLLAGVFTVLGGMAAVYFPSPTFGSLGDYASVVLWGTAFGKGADAVAKFLASK